MDISVTSSLYHSYVKPPRYVGALETEQEFECKGISKDKISCKRRFFQT